MAEDKGPRDTQRKANTRCHVSLLTATRILGTTTTLFHVKQFILYQTLIKSTAKVTHAEALTGPRRASRNNGIFSLLQLALTCWVENRLQPVILLIQDDVHTARNGRNTAKSSLALWVWWSFSSDVKMVKKRVRSKCPSHLCISCTNSHVGNLMWCKYHLDQKHFSDYGIDCLSVNCTNPN